MGGLPMEVRFAQAFAQLVQSGLSQERQAHVPITDVKVESARSAPAQFLVIVEELFDMPAFWEIGDQALQSVALAGAHEALVLILGGLFPGALDQLVEGRLARGAAQRLG